VIGDPNLDPELRARAEEASALVPQVLAAAAKLTHDDSLLQIHALALHATIIEQFSACILLAQFGEANPIPIILRSMYEALVDLDNLLQDPSYLCRIDAANIKQTLTIMRGGLLREAFQKGRKEDFDQLSARLAEIEDEGKASLNI
jgi:hypothetical protein